MRKFKLIIISLVGLSFVWPVMAQSNFGTSLHKTRNGKPTWYNSENGGFETLTNVPIEDVGCVECHDAVDANGTPYPTTGYTPGCVDCHATNTPPFPGPVTQNDCLGCHSREKAIITLNIPDVHRSAGLECKNCHPKEEVHGDDGIEHASMFDPGAITTDCSNQGCHPSLPSSHNSNDPHGGKLHCTSCHASTNLACYNCHFESQLVHIKRAYKQITNFTILVNRTKDNKVHPATFQSLSYQGNTWIAMGPSVAHTITKTNARVCTDCHQNFGGSIQAIADYNTNGIIKFATWNTNDSTLSWLQGVVPLPLDYLRSFKMDFITYNGDPGDPLPTPNNKNWSLVGDHADGFQLLYATPLTKLQMKAIGMDTTKVVLSVEPINNQIPSDYNLEQNYPNPFNPTTTINYSIPADGFVEINLYDALGNFVKQLISEQHKIGNYRIELNAAGLSSGVYFYQIRSGSFSASKKLILMK